MVSGLASATSASAAPSCAVTAQLVNPCRAWFGAYTSGYGAAGSGVKAQTLGFESRIGRQAEFIHTFHGVGQNTLTSDETYFINRPNTFLFTDWKPAANWGDATGDNDSINAGIDQMAASLKAVAPHQIMLTIFHEPENDASSLPSCPAGTAVGTAGSPDQYRAMWQNVENRFKADGVSNVVYVMTYISWPKWDCTIKDFWPGNNLVDWVAWDPYSLNNTDTFDSTGGRFYNLLEGDQDAAHDFDSKPWAIGEFGIYGSADQPHAYAYYDGIKADIDSNTYPRIKYWSMWDSNVNATDVRIDYDKTGVRDDVEQQHAAALANDANLAGTYTVDQSVPTATIARPADASNVSGPTTVSANVADDTAVASAQLVVDGTAVGAPLTAPDASASFTWDSTSVTDGIHSLQVRVTDPTGHVATSSAVSVNVVNHDSAPPTVPTGVDATTTGAHAVTISWTASTDNVGVAGYDVYRNGTKIASTNDTTRSYTDSGIADGADYDYVVDAFDAAGNISAQSADVTAAVADVTTPSVPADVSAVLGAGKVSVTWSAASDNVGVTGYDVFRNGVEMATVPADTTSYDDTTVRDASTYRYTVDAFDAAGNTSVQTDPATVTTADTSAPSVPAHVVAMATTGTSASISWDAATDDVAVTGYTVYRDGTKIATVPAPTTSFTDTGLSDASSYRYAVSAFDAAANASAQSAGAVVTTADSTAPSTPGGLTATAGGGSSVALSWSASSDNVEVAGYDLYRDGTFLSSVGGGATSYTDTTVGDAHTYTYTVDAYDAAGNTSGRSASSSARTADTTPPSVPGNVTAGATSGSAVTVSWTASSDNVAVTGYNLYRDGALVGLVNGSTTTFGDTGLSDATAYGYSIAAVDAAGNLGPRSPASSVTTRDLTAPTVPAGVTATLAGASSVRVGWVSASDNVAVAGYDVYRNGALLTTVGASATSFTDTGLTGATTYSYTVAASDAAGNLSAQSTAVSAKTPDTTAPSTPTGITPGAQSATSVKITWKAATDNVGVSGYRIYRNGILVGSTTAPNVQFTDTGLTPKTKYVYAVEAFDAAGNTGVRSSGTAVTTPADTTAPSAPTGVALTSASYTSLTLHWSAATDNVGVAGYNVYRNGIKMGTSSTTSYTDAGLANGTAYNYTVSAYDAAGNTSTSPATSLSTLVDNVAPSAPANVKAVSTLAYQVNLSWNAATDTGGSALAGYRIYRSDAPQTVLFTVGPNATSFADTRVKAKTAYTYTVVAFDGRNNQSAAGLSNAASTPAGKESTVPTVASLLKVVSTTATTVTISWKASTDAGGLAGYHVYRNGVYVGDTSATTVTFTDSGLARSTTYTYTVVAFDTSANVSAMSATLSAKTTA